ncbi:MAG: DUF1512 domain-containing protein [Nitrososphaeria archaeon]|jgi:hypothetical protein
MSNAFMNDIVYISNIIWIMLIVIFIAYGQRIQLELSMRSVSKHLNVLENMAKGSLDRFINELKKRGVKEEDAKNEANIIVNSFMISPTDLDPHGIIEKLDQLVKTYEKFFITRLKSLVQADDVQIKNLSGLAESALALNEIYKYARHQYLSAKNYHDYYSLIMLQVMLPFIMEEAEAYYASLDPIINGKSIGDALGPLVAVQLANGAQFKEIEEDTEIAETDYKGRKVLILKAKGPGSTVGRPGDAVKKVIENFKPKIIITVDAGLKLEGEETGETVEGFGVAMGGPGNDRFKIEESATQYNIPIHAFIVKMSLKEAISEMNDNVRRAALQVVEKVKSLIEEKTSEGDSVLVVGVGNTIGIP